MNIKTIPIAEIQRAKYNPRKALKPGDPAYDKLKKAVATFGLVEPLVWNQRTKNLVGGHQRLSVIEERGDTQVEVSVVDLNEREEKALNLALNKHSGEWDFASLADMLQELDAGDLDMDVTGFGAEELERLMTWTAPNAGLTDEDAVPEAPKEPISKTGDLWLMGRHRLLCGDATQSDDVARLMDGDTADLVFTDPPYGVDYDGGTKVRDKLQGDASTALYGPACLMAHAFSKDKAALYLWHAGVKGIAAAAAAAAAGYEIRCEIVWNKNQAQFGALSAQYKQKHEPAYYCHKKGHAPFWFGPTNETTVWDCERSRVNEFHPTQKPVLLAERAIGNSSTSGDMVLDLFLGSGSTLIACEKTGRMRFGMEIEPMYVDVAVKRWEQFSGKQAERA